MLSVKLLGNRKKKINIIVHFELTYFGNIMQRLVKLLYKIFY